MSVDGIRTKVQPLLRRCQTGRAALFGSIVCGEDTPKSDIDLLVRLSARAKHLDYTGSQLGLDRKPLCDEEYVPKRPEMTQ